MTVNYERLMDRFFAIKTAVYLMQYLCSSIYAIFFTTNTWRKLYKSVHSPYILYAFIESYITDMLPLPRAELNKRISYDRWKTHFCRWLRHTLPVVFLFTSNNTITYNKLGYFKNGHKILFTLLNEILYPAKKMVLYKQVCTSSVKVKP